MTTPKIQIDLVQGKYQVLLNGKVYAVLEDRGFAFAYAERLAEAFPDDDREAF